MSITTITTGTEHMHHLTEDEATYLMQLIELDGYDAVVLYVEPWANGHGQTHAITPEAWEAVQYAIETSKAAEEGD